jgi:hypothetical protein
MDVVPMQDADIRYCVLDYSDQQNPDFFWYPLIFLDQFPRPAADLKIGPYRLQVPLDWSVVIADKHMGTMEIIEIKHINDRDFDAFCYNPIDGYMPSFHEISIDNIFPDVSWSVPKLKHGHILAIPLTDGPSPVCAYFLRDINKCAEVLDITKIFA